MSAWMPVYIYVPIRLKTCRANLHKWSLAQSLSCDCGQRQTMNYIVDTCPLTTFEDGLSTKWMMMQSYGCNLQHCSMCVCVCVCVCVRVCVCACVCVFAGQSAARYSGTGRSAKSSRSERSPCRLRCSAQLDLRQSQLQE